MTIECAGILAAGDGARFRAAGNLTPKPLIRVGGIPLIERCLRLLQEAGVRQVHCAVNERSGPSIRRTVDALDLGLEVAFVVKDTASSWHSLDAIREPLHACRRFALMTVDWVADPHEVLGFLRSAGEADAADGVLACTSYVRDEKPLWIETDATHGILQVAAPPQQGRCVTGGLYVFAGRVLDEMERARRIGTERLRNYLTMLSRGGYSLRGHHFSKIVDVDDPGDLREAEQLVGRLPSAAHRA